MQEIIEERNATSAKKGMAKLRVCLEQEKANTETNRAHMEQANAPIGSHNAKMYEQGRAQVESKVKIGGNRARINSCWKDFGDNMEQGKAKTFDIISQLNNIGELLKSLPTSKRAEMQPCFSNLCAEADIVMSKIADCMMMQVNENQRCLKIFFHEVATKWQSSS